MSIVDPTGSLTERPAPACHPLREFDLTTFPDDEDYHELVLGKSVPECLPSAAWNSHHFDRGKTGARR
jgi:hypothetical protein